MFARVTSSRASRSLSLSLSLSLTLFLSRSVFRWSVFALSRAWRAAAGGRSDTLDLDYPNRVGTRPIVNYRPVARLDALSRRILILGRISRRDNRSFLATRDAGIRIVERGATRARTCRGILRPLVSRKIRNFDQISRGRDREEEWKWTRNAGRVSRASPRTRE